ncbi:MAG: hypothetical protein HOV81_39985 [Kofleriaceae bacterium]|nr:hypothetical protein [Kofleriaceae bacterium]
MRLLALVVTTSGCGAAITPASTTGATETAIGAYLENPQPYVVAGFDACHFTGPVSQDFRATASGLITATCDGDALHWNAVPATRITIDGPATIRAPAHGLDYIYRVSYLADAKHVGGRGRIAWSTGPDCSGLADLHGFNDATFVVPRAAGRCTLHARDHDGRTAQLTIQIE